MFGIGRLYAFMKASFVSATVGISAVEDVEQRITETEGLINGRETPPIRSTPVAVRHLMLPLLLKITLLLDNNVRETDLSDNFPNPLKETDARAAAMFGEDSN